jgi:hypothetical protein
MLGFGFRGDCAIAGSESKEPKLATPIVPANFLSVLLFFPFIGISLCLTIYKPDGFRFAD